jgi:hypothetical protein
MSEEKIKHLLNIIILVMIITAFILMYNYERYGKAFGYPIVGVFLISVYKRMRFH